MKESIEEDDSVLQKQREIAIATFKESWSEEALWDTVVVFQGYQFYTYAKHLPFRYQLKVGRDGTLNRELIISLRKDSKTLTWSSIRLAFEKAKECRGQVVSRPKALGDIRGISYVYAMFLEWGIVKSEE